MRICRCWGAGTGTQNPPLLGTMGVQLPSRHQTLKNRELVLTFSIGWELACKEIQLAPRPIPVSCIQWIDVDAAKSRVSLAACRFTLLGRIPRRRHKRPNHELRSEGLNGVLLLSVPRLDDFQPGYWDKMPSVEGGQHTSAFQGGGCHDKVVRANHFARGVQSCPDTRLLECG
jgi:hypothetical protein